MANIRVYELAKELGLTNKECLDLCDSLGIGVKSHSSSVVEPQADRVRRKAEREGLIRDEQPPEPKKAPAKKAPAKKAAATKAPAKKAPAKKAAAKKAPATKAPLPLRLHPVTASFWVLICAEGVISRAPSSSTRALEGNGSLRPNQ